MCIYVQISNTSLSSAGSKDAPSLVPVEQYYPTLIWQLLHIFSLSKTHRSA